MMKFGFKKVQVSNYCYLFILSMMPFFYAFKTIFYKDKLFIAEIHNPTGFSRLMELVEINYSDLQKKVPADDLISFKIIDNKGEEIPYQFEYKGMKQPLHVLVQLSLSAFQTTKLFIEKGTPSPLVTKTYARFVPERYDDFAWENDKIAFRMYGHALSERNDNAFGIDVWAKRTSKLIINKWYAGENYHLDNGEGLDFYGVGKSLGAGDIAPYSRDSIFFTRNFTDWKLLDTGALRSSFQLIYPKRNAMGILYNVIKTITIDAGSQLCRMEVVFSFSGLSKLPVTVGIVKRPARGTILFSEKDNLMGYWEPEMGKNGTIGLGCVFKEQVKEMKIEQNHLLGITDIQTDKPYIYYFGAAWSKGGGIKSSEEWFSYLQRFSLCIQNPLEPKMNE